MPWPVPRRAPRKRQGFSVSSILKRGGNASRKRNALLIVGFDVSTWVGKGRRKDPVLEAPAQLREVARKMTPAPAGQSPCVSCGDLSAGVGTPDATGLGQDQGARR